ncbi:efflux transporter, outer membrane factor (OMF) lipo, NodT family protein [Burkholderia cenocepacia]|uniref:Efflux transporter, outer membrane factor (OMF) lipo, NodT family protein n=1 Tax=Burkholderia cenocepacia TaxID=95486 RepID=A0AAN0RPY0_9BURK|nr:efflux transporter, outer membrane factor (OMF) lipo, NodT family protein [Burkholderia cenocepacia]
MKVFKPRPIIKQLGWLTAALLCGCAVGPDYVRPVTTQGADYSRDKLPAATSSSDVLGGTAQRLIAGMDIPGLWWTLFRSPELNDLVGEALRANPNVAAAQASLRQANELAYADRASLFPTIGASASGTREKASSGPFPPQLLTVNAASLTVSYAPDVFGGTRRQIESAAAQAEYQRFQLEATYLTLTANVVNTAVTLASVRDQIAATQEIVRVETAQLEVVKSRLRLGALSNADLLAQEAAVAQTRATLPPLQKQLDQARNQMTAYLGRFPNQERVEHFELAGLHLPDELPVSLPSAIVEQRPDVRAAEAQLHEASANIGVAIANQLPQFSLTGSMGTNASRLADLFSSGTGVWSLVGSVTQTIFDAGALRHRKLAAVAAYDASAAQYRGTVISAFQDVANALQALQTDADALKEQVAAERAARDSLNLTQTQYRLGAVGYVNLLTAQQTYENAVLARVRAQASRYSDTVALFQALGGGWWNRTEPLAQAPGETISSPR